MSTRGWALLQLVIWIGLLVNWLFVDGWPRIAIGSVIVVIALASVVERWRNLRRVRGR